jgi:serine/threonine protein phosphatase PrpC
MKGEGRENEAWAVEDIGGRARLEDTHSLVCDFGGVPGRVLGGVFDGHGGSEVADLAGRRFPGLFQNAFAAGFPADKALEKAFLSIDREVVERRSGCVAVAFFLDGCDFAVANTGDAELLLVSKVNHKILTELHRLSNQDEKMRIIDAGGHIDGSYVMDSKGHGLQCTRSLGDREFKDIGIISDPYLASARLCKDDLWIIAACDGLWDVMRPDEAATIARKMTTAPAVAEALQHEAVAMRGTPDNLTVLVVKAGSLEPAGKA